MANTLWLLLVFIGTFLFYIQRRFYTYDSRFMELASKIPGPRRLPFIGSAYLFFGLDQKIILQTLKRLLKTYQSVCSIWIGPNFNILVSKPKDVEVVLSSNKCQEKEIITYLILKSILGDGLVASEGEKWKKHRKLINPIFSLSNLKVFVDIFYSKARETYGLLEGELDNSGFDIFPYNEKCGINILFATNITNDLNNEFAYEKRTILEHLNNATDLFGYRLTRPWLYSEFIFSNLPCGKKLQSSITFSQELLLKAADHLKNNVDLNEKKKDILNSENNCDMKGSILNYLLQLQANPKNGLTDQDILDEIRTLLGGAFETTTAGIGFIIFLLSRHPEVQELIVNEIRHEFGSLDDKPITYDNLSKLHYLDRVVKEGLRLYPPVPFIQRRVSEETPLPSGITLPSGSNVIISIYNLHQDPESFPDPEKFNPDNFLPENVEKRSAYAFAPFSHGPRNCIGHKYAMLSIKTQLVVILRRFCVTPTDIEPELFSTIALKSNNGIHVRLQKRV